MEILGDLYSKSLNRGEPHGPSKLLPFKSRHVITLFFHGGPFLNIFVAKVEHLKKLKDLDHSIHTMWEEFVVLDNVVFPSTQIFY